MRSGWSWRVSCFELIMAQTLPTNSPAWRRALYHLRELTAQNATTESRAGSPTAAAPNRPGGAEFVPESTRGAGGRWPDIQRDDPSSPEWEGGWVGEGEDVEGWRKVDTLSESLAQDMLREALGGSPYDEHAVDYAVDDTRRQRREAAIDPPLGLDETELDELEVDTLHDFDSSASAAK